MGFSMGAEQAFQWAVSYPDFADRIVATSGTAKSYPHGVVRLEGQIAALTADPAFKAATTSSATKGLEAFGMVWAGWLYSQEWWRKELWRTPPEPDVRTVSNHFRQRFSGTPTTTSCRPAPGNATTWAPLPASAATWRRALQSIKAPLLYMPSETDLYFPLGDARYEAPSFRA